MPAAATQLRCRPIEDGDLPAIAALLHEGFPGRAEHWWMRGLDRLATRPLPADVPRFGLMLDSGSAAVGVLLLFYRQIETGEGTGLRCNVSSWYVAPRYRAYASQLAAAATRRRDATFVNISPAPHTWSAIEAQGFRRFSDGLFLALPSLAPSAPGARIRAAKTVSAGDLPEAELLAAHSAYGCRSVVVEADDGLHPFIFLPFRIRSGRIRLPILQLLFCRATADFARFAGTLAPVLLRAGGPVVMLDADGPVAGLRGYYAAGRRPKYFRGPDRPRHGDLAFSELAIFGA